MHFYPKTLKSVFVVISMHFSFVLKISFELMPQRSIFVIKKALCLVMGFYRTACLLTLSGCQEEALGMEDGKIPDSAIKFNYQVSAKHICILFGEISGS